MPDALIVLEASSASSGRMTGNPEITSQLPNSRQSWWCRLASSANREIPIAVYGSHVPWSVSLTRL